MQEVLVQSPHKNCAAKTIQADASHLRKAAAATLIEAVYIEIAFAKCYNNITKTQQMFV